MLKKKKKEPLRAPYQSWEGSYLTFASIYVSSALRHHKEVSGTYLLTFLVCWREAQHISSDQKKIAVGRKLCICSQNGDTETLHLIS